METVHNLQLNSISFFIIMRLLLILIKFFVLHLFISREICQTKTNNELEEEAAPIFNFDMDDPKLLADSKLETGKRATYTYSF